jgi:hypothetical protein
MVLSSENAPPAPPSSMLLSDNYAIHLKARKITSKHQHTLERSHLVHASGKFSCGEILTKTECAGGWERLGMELVLSCLHKQFNCLYAFASATVYT